MRNLLIGSILGISLTAGFTPAATPKDLKIVGESWRLSIAASGEVECEDASANVPIKVIECDYEAPPIGAAPSLPSRPNLEN